MRQDENCCVSKWHWKLSFPLPPEPENLNIAARVAERSFIASSVVCGRLCVLTAGLMPPDTLIVTLSEPVSEPSLTVNLSLREPTTDGALKLGLATVVLERLTAGPPVCC